MFCPQCGTSNPDGTHFCSNCGTALGQQGAPAGVATPPAQPPVQPQAQPPAPPPAQPPAPAAYPPAAQQGQGFGSAVGGGYQMGGPGAPGVTGAPAHNAVSVDFRRLGTGDLVAFGGTI